MNNIDRPRTGLPSCKFCGSTDRDSNGQCACRNVLYRLTHKPNQTDKQVKTITKTFNSLLETMTVVEARNIVSPRKTAAPKKTSKPKHEVIKPAGAAPEGEVDGYKCRCGFVGKGSLPSIRSHVAREKRLAAQASA